MGSRTVVMAAPGQPGNIKRWDLLEETDEGDDDEEPSRARG